MQPGVLDSGSVVSDQQSMGSSPGLDTCVIKSKTLDSGQGLQTQALVFLTSRVWVRVLVLTLVSLKASHLSLVKGTRLELSFF